MIKFTDDFLTGIDLIDNEHRQLISMLNEINDRMLDGADVRTEGMKLLNGLRDYAAKHFADEESYMESISDPELAGQKKAHRAFVDRIEHTNFIGMNDETMTTAVLDLLDYMSRWLMHHILGSDTLIGKTVSPFAFTDKYKTGIDLIDSEHQKLFDIMARVDALIHNDELYDRFDQIVGLINELNDYTHFHFNDEEKLMEEYHYSGLEAQKKAHRIFYDELDKIDLDQVDDDQEAYLEDLLKYLMNWLSGHILGMDKKIHDER